MPNNQWLTPTIVPYDRTKFKPEIIQILGSSKSSPVPPCGHWRTLKLFTTKYEGPTVHITTLTTSEKTKKLRVPCSPLFMFTKINGFMPHWQLKTYIVLKSKSMKSFFPHISFSSTIWIRDVTNAPTIKVVKKNQQTNYIFSLMACNSNLMHIFTCLM